MEVLRCTDVRVRPSGWAQPHVWRWSGTCSRSHTGYFLEQKGTKPQGRRELQNRLLVPRPNCDAAAEAALGKLDMTAERRRTPEERRVAAADCTGHLKEEVLRKGWWHTVAKEVQHYMMTVLHDAEGGAAGSSWRCL